MHTEKLSKIELLLLDVDGVLTDGQIVWDSEGREIKSFNVKDGQGIKMLQRAGVRVGIITARNSVVVDLRAKELGIGIVRQGVKDKRVAYAEIRDSLGLQNSQIAYMGDDVIDIPVLRQVGFSMAPSDAVVDLFEIVDRISAKPGGRGAVRECCDLILKGRGQWDDVVGVPFGVLHAA